MILRTRKQIPAPAIRRFPVPPVMASHVLAALTAGAGPNFGVLNKGLPHPRGLTPAPETQEAAVVDPTAASIRRPGRYCPKGGAGGPGDPYLS
jgi:hypothetical protein